MLPVAMVLVLGLCGGLIAAMTNLKNELVEGPNRALSSISDDQWFILQNGSSNLVEDSILSSELVSQLQGQGFQAIGFNRSYRSVEVEGKLKNALLFDLPSPPVVDGKPGVVVDSSLGVSVGGQIVIAGHPFRVTGLTEGTSSPGKEGVYLTKDDYQKISGESDAVFGVVLQGERPPEGDYALFTGKEFRELNAEYWLLNGGSLTDLVATLMIIFAFLVMIFITGMVFALTRKEMVTLRSIGASSLQVAMSEVFYALMVFVPSVGVVSFVSWGMVSLFQASTPGYIGGISVVDIGTGSGAMLLVILVLNFGSYLMIRRKYPSKNLALAMKEN